jgi:hypothetical protein
VPSIRVTRGRLWVWLGVVLPLMILLALLTGIAAWVFNPPPLDVRVTMESCSLVRYDDGAGHLPLAAVVQITNVSNSTVWFLRHSGGPTCTVQQLLDGKLESQTSVTWGPGPDERLQKRWTPLRPLESVTILAGPISEKASEFRVAVPFTTDRVPSLPFTTMFEPTEARWVFSPATKLVKRGQDYFPAAKPGAKQEEQVLSLK